MHKSNISNHWFHFICLLLHKGFHERCREGCVGYVHQADCRGVRLGIWNPQCSEKHHRRGEPDAGPDTTATVRHQGRRGHLSIFRPRRKGSRLRTETVWRSGRREVGYLSKLSVIEIQDYGRCLPDAFNSRWVAYICFQFWTCHNVVPPYSTVNGKDIVPEHLLCLYVSQTIYICNNNKMTRINVEYFQSAKRSHCITFLELKNVLGCMKFLLLDKKNGWMGPNLLVEMRGIH